MYVNDSNAKSNKDNSMRNYKLLLTKTQYLWPRQRQRNRRFEQGELSSMCGVRLRSCFNIVFRSGFENIEG